MKKIRKQGMVRVGRETMSVVVNGQVFLIDSKPFDMPTTIQHGHFDHRCYEYRTWLNTYHLPGVRK